tara:strand:+ start:12622 stop:13626 length:1005 start_codon:yes stop_codon:yes gene_type:complete
MKSIKDFIKQFNNVYWIYLGRSCYFDDLERFLVDCSNNNKLNHVVITYSKCKKKLTEIDKANYEFYSNSFTLLLRLIYLIIRDPNKIFIAPNVNLKCLYLLILEKLFNTKIIYVLHNHFQFKSSFGFFKQRFEKFLTLIFWKFPKIRAVCSMSVYRKQLKYDKNLKNRKTIFMGFPLSIDTNINNKLISKGKEYKVFVWGRKTPYKLDSHIKSLSEYFEKKKINSSIIVLSKEISSKISLKSKVGIFNKLISINCYPDNLTIDYFREITDFEFFPYIDISQSGPIRSAMEKNRILIIPKIAEEQCRAVNYKKYIIYTITKNGKLNLFCEDKYFS